MALEVEYTMEYQYPDLLVTEDCWLQRKSADSTVMDRKKAVVSYKLIPAEMICLNHHTSQPAYCHDLLAGQKC